MNGVLTFLSMHTSVTIASLLVERNCDLNWEIRQCVDAHNLRQTTLFDFAICRDSHKEFVQKRGLCALQIASAHSVWSQVPLRS